MQQGPSGLRGDLSAYAAQHGLDESLFKAILRKLDFARVQFEKDMADFSAGQKKKVLLARSLCEPSHLLVWDEPLNYVDVLSRIQLEETAAGIPADDRFRRARPCVLRPRCDKGRDALTA